MRTAIVGCGTVAAVHMAAVSRMAECQIVGFADIAKEKAEEFALKYGGRAYSSMEEMLEQDNPEVLHICTPHYLHTPMALYALEHAVHVFMEKPPVISREQLQQLCLCKSDRKLGICFQNRYNPAVQYAKTLLDSDKAGKVLGARAFVTWCRPAEYYTQSSWRGTKAMEGGGALINQSIHTMDLLVYLLGKPIDVEASMKNRHLKGVIEVEDTVEAYIRFQDAEACFYATTSFCLNSPPLIEIVCENMNIRMEELELTIYHKGGDIEKPALPRQEILGKRYWGTGHKDCIQDFYQALSQGRPYALELSNVLDSVKLMLAAYESSATEECVHLDEIETGQGR